MAKSSRQTRLGVLGMGCYHSDVDKIVDIVVGTWQVTTEMAPYLLLGFAAAGILSVMISAATVERHLGKPGIWQVIKAALLGVPIPLCSCSVVPVSATLYRHGATKGATLSFLASTPQTGVDSIAVTWSLLGPVVTLFRIAVAFVSGILAGVGIQLAEPETAADKPEAAPTQEKQCCCGKAPSSRLVRILKHGFRTLPTDIGRAMLLGLLLSGVLTALIPEDYFAEHLGSGIGSMLLMMVLGIPLYTCSSGSVPVALALVHAGISPGAALVFLVTGPATNAATVATIHQVLGRKAIVVYLASICATALAAGLLLDAFFTTMGGGERMGHNHTAATDYCAWLPSVWGVLLLLVLAQSLLPRRKK